MAMAPNTASRETDMVKTDEDVNDGSFLLKRRGILTISECSEGAHLKGLHWSSVRHAHQGEPPSNRDNDFTNRLNSALIIGGIWNQ